MSVLLVGANPGLSVKDGDSTVAFVSVWRVDWSEHGSGHAIVLWHEGRTSLVTTRPALGRWLAETFTRHFPEVDGLPWAEPEVTVAEVAFDLDLAAGFSASGGGVAVSLRAPAGHRLVTVAEFPGNGLALSTVYAPCAAGSLTVGGFPVAGQPEGFLADAEVWTAPAN